MPNITDASYPVILLQHSPYDNSLMQEGIEAALAFAAFDIPCKVLFMGPAVTALLPNQNTAHSGFKSISKQLKAFAMFGIETIYFESLMCEQYGIKESLLSGTGIDQNQCQQLLSQADKVLSF